MARLQRTSLDEEDDTSQRYLQLGMLISLAGAALSTYFGLTVDRFGWEVDITQWLQKFDLGPARFLETWVFWMGVKGVAGGVLVVVFAVFWIAHLRVEAVFLGLISVPDIINFGLREAIGRPRPSSDLVEVIGGPQGFSFPSGTTLHMLLFYGFLLYLARRHISSPGRMAALWSVGAGYIALSGLWVIYGGRHWFVDAIGGYLYGAFYLLVLIAAFRWTRERAERSPVPELTRFPPFLRKPIEGAWRLIT